jgi:c(7)-type cytochrome triheme protein
VTPKDIIRRLREQRRSTRLALVGTVAVLLFAVPASVISMPESVRIPIVKEHGTGDPPDAALFSHWTHAQYHCYECHPSIFPQRKLGFTHADMGRGRFCGACHDGQRAWHFENDPSVSCETCHVEREPSDFDDLDLDDLFGMHSYSGRDAALHEFWHVPLSPGTRHETTKE